MVADCTLFEETIPASGGVYSVALLTVDGKQVLSVGKDGRGASGDLDMLLTRLDQNPHLPRALPTLWDMRRFDFGAISAEAMRSMVFVMARHPGRIGVKRGFLVNTDLGFGTMRMFQQTASGHRVEEHGRMLVSYHRAPLLQWLIQEP